MRNQQPILFFNSQDVRGRPSAGWDAPPAGRKISFLFIKPLHSVQRFYEQERLRTMLPQANRAFIGVTVRFEGALRNSG